jgi:predicted secreted Zn-dependent protease
MTSTRSLLLALSLLALAGCSSLPPRQTPILAAASIRYYEVQGTTAAELRKELTAKGPKEGGRGFDAYTKWYFRWSWPGYGRAACDLSAAVVHADIEVTFPRWPGSAAAEPPLRDRWLRYIDALASHENGHVELSANHRDTILEAIRSSTCENADDAARKAVQSLNALSMEYDLKTRHGRRQGATFP